MVCQRTSILVFTDDDAFGGNDPAELRTFKGIGKENCQIVGGGLVILLVKSMGRLKVTAFHS